MDVWDVPSFTRQYIYAKANLGHKNEAHDVSPDYITDPLMTHDTK